MPVETSVRWSFLMVALVLAVAVAGCSGLEVDDRAAQTASEPRLEARLQALVEPEFRPDCPGGVVLVARRGEVLFRRAYGMADIELGVPMEPEHVLEIASITKQFTAVAILQLVEQGRLGLEDDVRKHLPGFDTRGRTITVEQVLTHTAGLPNLVDRADFEELARRDHTTEELLALTAGQPLHFEPGTGFRYSDTGYILLGAIIERLSGLSYGDYVKREIFRPLGMERSVYADDRRIIPGRARGYVIEEGEVSNAPYLSMTVPHAAGGLASTVDDLLRWHLALRAGSVLSPELLERAWSPRTLPDGTVSGYGFGWQICTLAGHRTVEHGGFIPGFLAAALQLPDDGLDVIVLVNNGSDDPDPGALARRLGRLLLAGSPDAPTHRLAAEERAALVGTYSIAPGDRREIFEQGGTLFSRRGDRPGAGPARPLAALSATELALADERWLEDGTLRDAPFVFRFELGPDGRAVRVRTFLRCEPVDRAERVEEVGQAGRLPRGWLRSG